MCARVEGRSDGHCVCGWFLWCVKNSWYNLLLVVVYVVVNVVVFLVVCNIMNLICTCALMKTVKGRGGGPASKNEIS